MSAAAGELAQYDMTILERPIGTSDQAVFRHCDRFQK
jgi:hypothetical protein